MINKRRCGATWRAAAAESRPCARHVRQGQPDREVGSGSSDSGTRDESQAEGRTCRPATGWRGNSNGRAGFPRGGRARHVGCGGVRRVGLPGRTEGGGGAVRYGRTPSRPSKAVAWLGLAWLVLSPGSSAPCVAWGRTVLVHGRTDGRRRTRDH
jgi:hypothetical protein